MVEYHGLDTKLMFYVKNQNTVIEQYSEIRCIHRKVFVPSCATEKLSYMELITSCWHIDKG